MKAIIVKNNEFETIGFEVVSSGRTLFSWGISPQSPFYFTKQINTNDWMCEIFKLIELKATVSEQRDFHRSFFEIASGQSLLKDNHQGVDFSKYDERLKRNEEMIVNIIKNII